MPSIAHHLDQEGRWRSLRGAYADQAGWPGRVPAEGRTRGTWPTWHPRNHLMGTLDLPLVELTYDVDGCLLDLPSGGPRQVRAGEWLVDRDSGGAYATYERHSHPERLYAHRVGLDLEAEALDYFAGVPLAYAFSPRVPGSACYSDRVARGHPVIQVRFDAVELKASEDLGGDDEPMRVRADAGQVLLDWPRDGSVGIPYLPGDGALQHGATEARGSVAEIVERGEVVEE